VEADKLGSEQLLDVRGASSTVVRTPETDVVDRREFRRDLVRVRIVATATADVIPRLPVTEADRELLDAVVLDNRDLGFAENVPDAEVTADRKRRSTLAREVAGLERLVRVQFEGFTPVFDTEVDTNTVLSPRRLDAGIAEQA